MRGDFSTLLACPPVDSGTESRFKASHAFKCSNIEEAQKEKAHKA